MTQHAKVPNAEGGRGNGDVHGVEDIEDVARLERLRRWRLALGGAEDGTGMSLHADDGRIDLALAAVYDAAPAGSGGKRKGGLGASKPGVARWLGDIREFFPSTVVQVIQRDAIDRLGLERLLLEPEVLSSVEPDIQLVGTLLALRDLLPDTTREVARRIVAQVVAEIEDRLASATKQAVSGAVSRAARTRRPRLVDVDWDRTIRANLRHYLAEHRTVVPERLVGFGRRQRALDHEVVIALDQSGSMASSVVHASVLASALASMRTLRTSVVAFDTSVVDLTEHLADPVDVLFGVQLGGGTDIDRAVTYCETLITQPTRTVFVLVSDLFEGGVRDALVQRMSEMVRRGITCVALLAIDDSGAPAFDHLHAAALAAVGVPAFACTPDRFGEMIAAAIDRQDLALWAAGQGFASTVPLF